MQYRRSTMAALILALITWSPPLRSQEPGEIGLTVIDETGPDSPIAQNMRPLQEFHDEMVRHPPRVWLHPVLPPNSLFFPAGWTGGVDDPSAGRNEGLRNTWSNMDTLAYTQHTWREYRKERGQRRLCDKCNIRH